MSNAFSHLIWTLVTLLASATGPVAAAENPLIVGLDVLQVIDEKAHEFQAAGDSVYFGYCSATEVRDPRRGDPRAPGGCARRYMVDVEVAAHRRDAGATERSDRPLSPGSVINIVIDLGLRLGFFVATVHDFNDARVEFLQTPCKAKLMSDSASQENGFVRCFASPYELVDAILKGSGIYAEWFPPASPSRSWWVRLTSHPQPRQCYPWMGALAPEPACMSKSMQIRP